MLENWTDKNGLIKPQSDWSDSGNGVLYTAVYLIVTQMQDFDRFIGPLDACFQSGLLFRTPPTPEQPGGSFGQEQWDDHLGFAAMCVMKNFRIRPRQVLAYAFKHAGFFNTDGKLEWQDNMLRFPQVWALYWLAAFPWLKWPLFPILIIIGHFMRPDASDRSGTQLAWLYLFVARHVYPGKFDTRYNEIAEQFYNTCRQYYGPDHPTVSAYTAIRDRERVGLS